MPLLKKSVILVFALLAGVCLSGAMYSWTDGEGIKHYSNIAPPPQAGVKLLQEEKFTIPQGYLFEVVKVYDGDTLQVEGFGVKFKIRLQGIDSPELGRRGQKSQPYGLQAKRELTRLVSQKKISLKQYGIGGYNRVLAEVFAGTRNVNLEMVRSGLAEVYQGKLSPAFDSAAYFQAQERAKRAGKGMWLQGPAYKSPGQWRREHPLK